MLLTLLVFLLIPVGCLYLWPLVDRLLPKRTFSPLETALTTFASSVGLLAFVMFWVGLVPGLHLLPYVAPFVIVVGLLAGWHLNRGWFSPARWRIYWSNVWGSLVRLDLSSIAMLTILAVGLLMLLHGLYYPFVGDDAISRYGLQAFRIYRARELPQTVFGYPPLLPFSFAAIWFALGDTNEHLARVLPVLMSAGMVGATYITGRKVGGRPLGLLAALLIALTPNVIRYGTLAYTDIPTTFPLTLAIFVTLHWWQTGQGIFALLAGVLVSIGLFTKQSALIWLPGLAALPVVWSFARHRHGHSSEWRNALRAMLGFILPSIFLSGPWFLRNYLIGGPSNVFPIAGLYHLLSPGVGVLGLLPSLGRASEFGPVLSFVFAAGWISGLGMAVYQGLLILIGRLREGAPYHLIFASVVVPYWIAWWSRFSFDGRFLVFILPYMSIWTAQVALLVFQKMARPLGKIAIPWLPQSLAIPVLAILVYWGARDRFGGAYYAVTQPFASEQERLIRAKGSLIDLVNYIKANFDPVEDHIAVMDGRMLYYLDGYNVESLYPLWLSDLQGFDYLVHSSSIFSVYDSRLGWDTSEFYLNVWNEAYFEIVYESGGVHIMRIISANIPDAESSDKP